jgi:hypothetical protein
MAFSIVSNKLHGVGPAKILHNTAHPDGVDGKQHFRVTFTPDAGSDNVTRILVAAADFDNYLYAEVETTSDCSSIRLGQVEGGVDVYLTDPVPMYHSLGDEITLNVCWQPAEDGEGTLSAATLYSNIISSGWVHPVASVEAEGAKVGLEVVDGTTDFDSVVFSYHKDEEEEGRESCPECSAGCGLHAELFMESSTTPDLGCHWSQVAGTWTGGTGLVTTNGSAMVICLQPGTPQRQNVGAEISLGSNDDQARIIFDYVDSNNYHYAQIRVNTSVTTNRVLHTVHRVTGGITSTLRTVNVSSSTIPRNGDFRVCVRNGYIVSTYASVGGVIPYSENRVVMASPHGGKFVGVGTGTVNTGVSFTKFLYADPPEVASTPGCGECAGPICSNGCDTATLPSFWLVELEGMQNYVPPPPHQPFICNCDDDNRAYIVPATGGCTWEQSSSWIPVQVCPEWPPGAPTPAGGSSHLYPATVTLTNPRTISVALWRRTGPFSAAFSYAFTGTIPGSGSCAGVNRLELFTSSDLPDGSCGPDNPSACGYCNYTGLRVFITAI